MGGLSLKKMGMTKRQRQKQGQRQRRNGHDPPPYGGLIFKTKKWA